jgi:hypothetical protein
MTAIKTLAAVTHVKNMETPFLPGQPIAAFCTTGTPSIYGANHPGKNSATKYLMIEGTGAKTSWDEDDYAILDTVHVDTGSLAIADQLRVIVMVDGVIKKRVAASASPSAGQFKTSTESGTKGTLTLGDTVAAGGKIEVLILAAADVTALETSMTANIRYEEVAYDFMVADTLAYVEKLFD